MSPRKTNVTGFVMYIPRQECRGIYHVGYINCELTALDTSEGPSLGFLSSNRQFILQLVDTGLSKSFYTIQLVNGLETAVRFAI